jgi:hypothetical protein
LNFPPDRQSTIELCLAGQTQPSFSPVLAAAFCDPASPDHDLERSRQGRAVHCEHFGQLVLGHFSGRESTCRMVN